MVDEACHPADHRSGAHPGGGPGNCRSWWSTPELQPSRPDVIGALVQYPATDGGVEHWGAFCERAHAAGALVTVATDLLALTLLDVRREAGAPTSPSATASASECPWDTAGPTPASSPPATPTSATCPAGSSASPGTAPAAPRSAWRCRPGSSTSAAKRPPATSAPRRCCSPSLPACTPSITAPDGLTRIARRVHGPHPAPGRRTPAAQPQAWSTPRYFDTLCVEVPECGAAPAIIDAARARTINLRKLSASRIGISLDETDDARRRSRPSPSLLLGGSRCRSMLDDLG